jgi:hypothetical protein
MLSEQTPIKEATYKPHIKKVLDIKTFQGIYEGQLLGKKSEPNAKKQWELLKLSFIAYDGSQRIFRPFIPLNWKSGTIQPNEMVLGDMYEVGYTQSEDFVDGEVIKRNQVRYILPVSKETIPQDVNVVKQPETHRIPQNMYGGVHTHTPKPINADFKPPNAFKPQTNTKVPVMMVPQPNQVELAMWSGFVKQNPNGSLNDWVAGYLERCNPCVPEDVERAKSLYVYFMTK